MATDRTREIEQKIAELKARWPAHSVPSHLWEELEGELKEAAGAGAEENDGGATGSARA